LGHGLLPATQTTVVREIPEPDKKEEIMKNQFDELTKQMAQSVTRRAALKKFGLGLAGIALACLGLANKAGAATGGSGCKPKGSKCQNDKSCCSGYCIPPLTK
jgi:hypothetical protein